MAKKIAIDIDIQGTKDVIELQKQLKATNKELKKTEDVQAYNELLRDVTRIKSQLQEARKAQRQAVDAFKATDEGVGAYSRLSAQLRVARNNLKDLKASGESTGEEVEKLTNEVNQLDTSLKDIDRSVGQTNREVGAYEEAVRKAIGVTDAQTGAFTRLEGKAKILRRAYKDVATESGKNSKEARKLAKELDKVERKLKQVGTTAERSGGRIGGFRTQVRGLGPAFSNIANGFIIFSEIPALLEDLQAGLDFTVQALNNYNESNNEALKNQSLVNDQIDRAAEGYFKERQEVKALFKPLEDDNLSRDNKRKLIDNINTSYGEYLPNLLTETATTEDLDKALQAVNKGLASKFAIQAQEARIAEITKKITDEEVKFQQNAAKARARITEESAAQFGKTEAEREATSIANIRGGTDKRVALLVAEASVIKSSTDAVTKALLAAGIAFDESTEDLNKTAEESEAEKNARIAKARKAALGKQKESGKKRIDEAKKQADQLLKLQNKLIAELAKIDAKAALEVSKLQQQNVLNAIKNQEAGLQKELALEDNATKTRLSKFTAQSDKFEAEARIRQGKINAAFGEGSQQALSTIETIDKQRISLAEQTNTAIEIETAASLTRRNVIRKTFNDKALQERLTELQAQQTAITTALAQEELKIREQRARGQINAQEAEEQSLKNRVEALNKQLEQLGTQDVALSLEKAFGADIAQTEFDKIAAARQNLNTQLAELEEQQTKKVSDETAKRLAKQKAAIEMSGQFVGVAFDAINLVADAANAAQIKRIEEQEEERAANLESLNTQLGKASGLEKAFLKQKVAEEIAASELLAAQRERIEKKAAIANKALAIIQAVINTAVAVSAQLSVPVGGFALAALAGAIGAVEIATIAAQPLATGGIVGFENGGRVSQGQNIATQPNGDNVLATLKRGEVVLNAGQQSRMGGAKAFRSAGVPGFQSGGIVSPPMGAPSLAQAGTAEQNSRETLVLLAKNLEATNNRIDNLKVIYTTETETAINDDKKDRKEITQRATL